MHTNTHIYPHAHTTHTHHTLLAFHLIAFSGKAEIDTRFALSICDRAKLSNIDISNALFYAKNQAKQTTYNVRTYSLTETHII